MGGTTDPAARLETVAKRVEFLDRLAEDGPLAPRDLVDALPHSRATVTRALRELRDAELVEKVDGGYRATLPALLATDEYHRYRTASTAVLSADSLLRHLPVEHALPADVLVDADTILAEGDIPVRALEAVSDRIRRADRASVYLPTLVNTHLLRVWHEAVRDSTLETTALFDTDLLTVLQGQYPRLLAGMAAEEGVAAYETTGPPYGIVRTTVDERSSVAVVVYEDDTVVRGVLTNDSAAAVAWADDRLDRLLADARVVTDELAALGDAVADAPGPASLRGPDARPADPAGEGDSPSTRGRPLPLDLEAEGFVRLSEAYFDAHNLAAPAVSWRTGFTLAEVQGGHAVDRYDDSGRNLTGRLVEDTRSGTDHVVVGPPGSGKSTVCMAVACEWYDRELGPVIYRERGTGGRLESTPVLEAYLRHADGRALVVVEDAVRDEANAVFEVMQSLDAEPSVSFLLDARTHEWRSPDAAGIDSRLDAYRRRAVEQLPVPDLDADECARFVDHFAGLVDGDLNLSGDDLFGMVEAGRSAGAGEEVPTGDALVAQHHLARHHDPPVETDAATATALDDAVRETYQRLGTGDDVVADVAVLVALLTAAGVPVAREYLYAAADDGGFADLDDAIAALEGCLVFEADQPRLGSPTTYRTRHETWSVRYLEQVRAHEPMHAARERLGRPVSRLLELADRPGRRQAIEAQLGGSTPHLHRIEADPQAWADELAERVFGVGLSNADLAPLFGATGDDALDLPAACSVWTRLWEAYWRGEMNRTHGDLARAEREYRTLGELAEQVDLAGARLRGSVSPEFASGPGADTAPAETHRLRWLATSATRLGTVARERSEYETARAYHEEALERFREIDDRGGEATSLKNLGVVAFYRSDFEAAREYYEQGLELARTIDAQRIEVDCRNNLAGIAWKQGAYARARELLERSLASSRDLGDDHAEYTILNNLGDIAQAQDDYDQARDYYTQSLAIFRDLGNRRSEATTLTNLGQVAERQGAYDRARGCFEESLAIKRDLGDQPGVAQTLLDLGRVDLARGAYDRASDRFDRSLELARELGDQQGEAAAQAALGEVALARGALERAADAFGTARDLAEALDARAVAADTRLHQGTVAYRRGRFEAADAHAEAALATYEVIGSDLGLGRCRLLQGRLALELDDVETARERARTALETFEAIGADHWIGRGRRLLGHVAAAAGRSEAARDHWRASLDSFQRVGAPPDALRALEALVDHCRRQGDLDRADEWVERARELLTSAPAPTAAAHRDWVERQAGETGGG